MASNEKNHEEPPNKRIKVENGIVDLQDDMSDESQTQTSQNMNETSESQGPLVLLLDWSSRDSVILSMNRFSSALYSKSCSIETRKSLIKENHSLIRRLMTLPVQSKGERFKNVIDLTEDDEVGGQKETPGPKLKLQWSLRQSICDCLFKNHHSIMYFDDVDEQAKKALIETNINLVQKLMSLEVAEEVDPTPKIKKEKIESSQSQLNGASSSMLVNGVSETVLDNKFSVLKDQLKEYVTRLINGKPETSFTFKINNVTQFLRMKDEKRFSDRFYVRNIPFFCVIQNKIADKVPGSGHLEVFLHCDYEPKDKSFACFVKVDLTLSTNVSEVREIHQSFEFNYLRRMGCGVQSFVTHAELTNPKKGFILNNCIYVGIKLVSDKPTGS